MTNYRSSRKTTPKVQDGRVHKKNRHQPTRLNSLSVGVEKPDPGHRHVVTKDDVWKFLRLVPDWKRISTDLDLIFLQAGDEGLDGWYEYPELPAIALCAWHESLAGGCSCEHFRLHEGVFDRVGALSELRHDNGEEFVQIQFTENSAKAYHLLHIFLHELGHHHFRITKGRGTSGGSEAYAEKYAFRMEKQVWPRYREAFRFDPAKERAQLTRLAQADRNPLPLR